MSWGLRWWRRPPVLSIPIPSLIDDGFVAVDLETTGLNPRRDVVVSMAVVPFVGGCPEPGWKTLIDPQRPIPPESTGFHGITDAMVAGAPSIADGLDAFDAACADRVMVGHALGFDLAVLARARRALRRPVPTGPGLDTMRLAAGFHRGWVDYGLDTVATRLGVEVVGRHTAEGDALAAGRVLLALLPTATARGYRTVEDLLRLQRTVVLPR